MDDLIAELRDGSRRGTDTCTMAANVLEEIRSENERLRNALKEIRMLTSASMDWQVEQIALKALRGTSP